MTTILHAALNAATIAGLCIKCTLSLIIVGGHLE